MVAEETIKQIFWLAGISTGLLFILLWFILSKLRHSFWFETKLFFKRPFGYGIQRIIYPDRQEELRIEKIRVGEISIERENTTEIYVVNPTLVQLRSWDRIPVATFLHNNPIQIDYYNQERYIEMSKEINGVWHTFKTLIPEVVSKTFIKSDEADALIQRHKLLSAKDWLKKNLKTLMIVVLIVGGVTIIAIGADVVITSKALEQANAGIAKAISVCSQRNLPIEGLTVQ